MMMMLMMMMVPKTENSPSAKISIHIIRYVDQRYIIMLANFKAILSRMKTVEDKHYIVITIFSVNMNSH